MGAEAFVVTQLTEMIDVAVAAAFVATITSLLASATSLVMDRKLLGRLEAMSAELEAGKEPNALVFYRLERDAMKASCVSDALCLAMTSSGVVLVATLIARMCLAPGVQ